MPRLIALLAGLSTMAAAWAIYGLKHDTRRIEARVHAVERAIEKAQNDIAALQAERAYLGRPERIDALARNLGLGPTRPDQYRRLAPAAVGQIGGTTPPGPATGGAP